MPKIYAKYSPEVIAKMRKQAEEEERRKKESEATLADRLWPDAPTQNYAPAKSSSSIYQASVAGQSPMNESQKSNQLSETEARIAADRRLMESLWPDTSMQGQNKKPESNSSSLGGVYSSLRIKQPKRLWRTAAGKQIWHEWSGRVWL